MSRLYIGFLLSLCLAAGSLQAAPRVHLIVAVDSTDKNIGPAVLIDGNMIKHVFQVNVPSAQLKVHDVQPVRFGVSVAGDANGNGILREKSGKLLGVEVKAVGPGTPAEKAGLEVKDILVKMNDAYIRSVSDFDQALATSGPQLKLTLRNWRDNKFYDTTIQLNDTHLMTRSDILATLRSVKSQAAADDCVVFYYSGHGAYDTTRGFYFDLPQREPLFREEVSNELKAMPTRLKILLSDCCWAQKNIQPVYMSIGKETIRVPAISARFSALFFEPRGFLDVTSCRKDQVSLAYEGIKGSVFTVELVEQLNQKTRTTWQALLAEVDTRANRAFQQIAPDGVKYVRGDGQEVHQTEQRLQILSSIP